MASSKILTLSEYRYTATVIRRHLHARIRGLEKDKGDSRHCYLVVVVVVREQLTFHALGMTLSILSHFVTLPPIVAQVYFDRAFA